MAKTVFPGRTEQAVTILFMGLEFDTCVTFKLTIIQYNIFESLIGWAVLDY